MPNRRALLITVAVLLAVAWSSALLMRLHERPRPVVVELDAAEPAIAYPDTPPLTSTFPMPSYDETGRNPAVRAHHRDKCREGDLDSCDVYASMLATGVGGRTDVRRALAVSRHACAHGHEDSCTYGRGLRKRLGLPPARLGELP